MTKQEFNEISKIEIKDEVVFDKIEQAYYDSKNNKFDFINNLMQVFKAWVFDNLDNLLITSKEQLLNHFVIYELDYYENL